MRLTSIILLLLLGSCKKDQVSYPSSETQLENGMIVLCEGLFQQNNSSVSWIDFSNSEISNSFFLDNTQRQLGDTGNDIQQYGNKIYIVVNVSSTIEVIDAVDFSPIKQIPMNVNSVSKQPRNITFYEGKAFVTCYDGFVDVIDTNLLEVTKRIAVGSNPEGLAVVNNKLYVSNSGGLNSGPMDSTVSIINLGTELEEQKVRVGLNPGQVISDADGDVYVAIRGNYASVSPSLARIDSQTDLVIQELPIEVSSIVEMNGKFLLSYYDFNTTMSSVKVFDPVTELIENTSLINDPNITTLYGVSYSSLLDKIFVLDAMNFINTGYVRKYSSNGTWEKDYHVGLNPTKVLFYE